jgi:hypothetical protein
MDSLGAQNSLTWQIILATQYALKSILVMEENFADPRAMQRLVHFKHRQWLIHIPVV